MCLGLEKSVVYCANETNFYMIPLMKGNTSCRLNNIFKLIKLLGKKCETRNLQEFFMEILLSSTITKWVLDALEFLRQCRIFFSELNFKAKPKNVGCVRTLDSITLENFSEGFIGHQTIQQIAKRFLKKVNL